MAQHSQATNGLSPNDSFKFRPSLHAASAELAQGSAKHAQRDSESAGPSSTAVHLRVSTGQHSSHPGMIEPAPASYASSTTSATSADDYTEVQGGRGSGDGVSAGQSTSSGWHPHDPEHLIVNGLGGAFLHPTHVFSPSRFVSGVPCCTLLPVPTELTLWEFPAACNSSAMPGPLPFPPSANEPGAWLCNHSLCTLEHFKSYTVSSAMLDRQCGAQHWLRVHCMHHGHCIYTYSCIHTTVSYGRSQ